MSGDTRKIESGDIRKTETGDESLPSSIASDDFFDIEKEHAHLFIEDDPDSQESDDISEHSDFTGEQANQSSPKLLRIKSIDPDKSDDFSMIKSKSFDFEFTNEIPSEEMQRFKDENKTLRKHLEELQQSESLKLSEIKYLQESLMHKQISINELNDQNQNLLQQISSLSDGSKEFYDQSKLIRDLKLDCEKKDKELERLRSIENSFKQTKAVLKDTSWTLRVKELELNNIRTEMRESYEKRLNELQIGLTNRDKKLQELNSEKLEFIETENDHILRIDELSQQIHLLKDELDLKDGNLNQLQYQLSVSEMERETSVKASTLNTDILHKELDALKAELEKYRLAESNEKDSHLYASRKVENDEKETNIHEEIENLKSIIDEKDKIIEHINEESRREVKHLQSEISKGKCHINELILLLEGVSTNSDKLPTGMVENTAVAPMPTHLITKRRESQGGVDSQSESLHDKSEVDSRKDFFHDSFDTIDDLEHDADFSEGAASLKQQMTHTIDRYETQIKELQNLYDHDIFSLESEKKELSEKLNNIQKKYDTLKNSESMANLTNTDLISHYEEKLESTEKHFEKIVNDEKISAKEMNQSLRQENEKMRSLIIELEEKFSNEFRATEKEIEGKFSENFENGLREILETQHEHMITIQRELQEELNEIQQKHEQDVTILHSQSDDLNEKEQLEEMFSQQILKLHEQQNELTLQNRDLQNEINSIQSEYDNLKGRYDKLSNTNNKLEEEIENERQTFERKIELLNRKVETISYDNTDNIQNVHAPKEMLEQKSQTDIVDYDKVEQMIQTEASYDKIEEKQLALQTEIQLLRDNLENAKSEVKNLHLEKDKFSYINEALNNELQNLKAEFEGQQSSFAFLDNSSFPSEGHAMELNELVEANEMLKHEVETLRNQLHMTKQVSSEIIATPVQAIQLEASRIDNIESILNDNDVNESSHFDSILASKDNEIEELKNQITSLTDELADLKTSLEESRDMNDENLKNLQDQLLTKAEVGQHLQEVFSQQLDYSQTQNKELLKVNDTLKEANAKLKKEIQDHQKEKSMLKSSIDDMSDKVSSLNEINDKYLHEKKIKEEYQDLVQSMKSQLKDKDENILQFLSKNDELKKKLETSQKDIQNMLKDSTKKEDEQEESLQIKISEIELLRNQIKELTEEWCLKEKDLKHDHDSNVEIVKDSLMKYNADSLAKLREDLDEDYMQRLKTVEDKLHSEYALRLKELMDKHQIEINDLQNVQEMALKNQKQEMEAEHKKVVGTVKSAMERTQMNEISTLQENYEKDVETVKYALQMEHESEVQQVARELENTHSKLLTELESSLNSAHEIQMTELKSNMEKECEKNVEEIILKLQQDFEKERDLEKTRYEMAIEELEQQLTYDYKFKYNEDIEKMKEVHLEECKQITEKYENEIMLIQQNHSIDLTKNREKLDTDMDNINKDFDTKLNSELDKQKVFLEQLHSENVLKIIKELKEESNTYLNETVKELQQNHTNEIDNLKINFDTEIRNKEKELTDSVKQIESMFDKQLKEKEEELSEQIKKLLLEIQELRESAIEQEAKFHEQLSEELLTKNDEISSEHLKELSSKDEELANMKTTYDNEVKALEDKYVAEIATLNLKHKTSLLKLQQEMGDENKQKEMKIIDCYEKIEERRATEDELQKKLSKIENKYKKAIEKQDQLTEQMKQNEKLFKEKRLHDIALIHWDLLSFFSVREIARTDDTSTRNLEQKLNELQSFHNECIEKFDLDKETLQHEVSELSQKNKILQSELRNLEAHYTESIRQKISSEKDDGQVISLGSDESVPSSAAEDFVLLALKNSVENLTGESPSLDLSESFVKSPKRESRKKLQTPNKLSPQAETCIKENVVRTMTDEYVQTDAILFLSDQSVQVEQEFLEADFPESQKHKDEIERLALQIKEFNEEKIKLDNELSNLSNVNEQLKSVNENLEKELDKQIDELKNKELNLNAEKEKEKNNLLSQNKIFQETCADFENKNKILVEEKNSLMKEISALNEKHTNKLKVQQEELLSEGRKKVKNAEDAKTLEFENLKNSLILQHQRFLDEFVMDQEHSLNQMKEEHKKELEDLKSYYIEKQNKDLDELHKELEEKINQVESQKKVDIDDPEVQEILTNEINTLKEKLEFDLRDEYKKMIDNLNAEHVKELDNRVQQEKDALTVEHENQMKDFAQEVENQHVEQLKAIDDIQGQQKVEIEKLKIAHAKEVENIKEQHVDELEKMKTDFEQSKAEEINAVTESIEEEINVLKEQLQTASDLKNAELSNQINLLNAQLSSNQRMKEDMQNNYEKMLANLRDDYNDQIEKLQQKLITSPQPLLQSENVIEVMSIENEQALKSENQSNVRAIGPREIEKETQTEMYVTTDKSLQTVHANSEDKFVQTEEQPFETQTIPLETQDDIVELNQKFDSLVEENQELKENLSTATSQTEVLVQRYERQEQESNNLVNILQTDVKQIAVERDGLKSQSDSLHMCLNNLLDSAKSIENIIHEKLDQMILVHTTPSNLTQQGLSMLEKDNSAKSKVADSIPANTGEDTLDNTLLSQTEGFIDDADDDDDQITSHDVLDPKHTKEVGLHLQLSVEQLLEMLDSSTTELRVNQASYEQLLQQANTYENNIKDLNTLNTDNQNSIDQLERMNLDHVENINKLKLENDYLNKELNQNKLKLNELKDNVEKCQTDKKETEDRMNNVVAEKDELSETAKSQSMEIHSLKKELDETAKELQVAIENSKTFEAEKENLNKELSEQQDMLNKLNEKFDELNAERDLLLKEKKDKEMKLAELKTELEQLRFDKKHDELNIPRKISKTSFENEEEIEKLQQEIASLNRIIDEMSEEKQGLRSQLLDSGYSAREDSFAVKKDMELLQKENEALQDEIKTLKDEILTLNNALNEAIFQKSSEVPMSESESDLSMNVSVNEPMNMQGISVVQAPNMVLQTSNMAFQTPNMTVSMPPSGVDSVDGKPKTSRTMSQKEEPNIIASKMESNVEAVAAIPTETNTTFVDKLNDLLNKIRKRDEGTPDEDREKNIKPLEMLELLEDEITNLENAFNKVQEDCKSLQDESSEKQEKLNVLETDIDKKNEEIGKLKDEYKKAVESEKKLITQANELDEQLSSVVAQKQNVISQLEKQLSDEQTKYSNIRRQLFQSEEDYDKKLVASRNELKQKEEEANELRIQTEKLSNQIDELNSTINETSENQTIENEVKIEKQLDYIKKLEDQLKNKQNALTSKNRELVELKSQLAESSSRQRGDGVDIDELESELENAQASIAQLQHEKKLRDETIEKHQTKIKTLIADGREKDETLREAQKSIEKLREEKVGVDLQLEEVLESSHVLDESKNVLIELEKQLEVFKKENQDLCKEKKILEEKSNKLEADLAEKNQEIISMQGEQSGDVSFIPQSDLVKLLLNDLQKEADEVLDLVLNYPDLHETHSTDNIRELQNIWANEKDALLSVIKSLKDFIANTTTSQLNLTIPPRDQSHDQTTSNENNTHEKRKNLMNLVKTIFEKEQEALIAEIESINACHAKDLPKEASSIRRHVEESKQLLADLESKDRDLLIQEISALRHTVEIVDSKIDQLNNQLFAKEKQNEKNQETILKLYVDVEEYQNKRNDLQKTVQEERSKTIDLTSQLAESRSNVQLLKHELETLSREKAQSDASTKHQDTVMKLYAQIENEQKRFADLSNKFEKLINEKSNLVMRLSEKDLKIESLNTELDTERSKAIKEHGNKEIHDDVDEKNKETMLKLYEQIEDAQIKNKELKNRIEHLTNEKNALSAKLTESNNKLKENSIVTTPSTSEVLEERYEKNQESLLKLYQIVDSEQEKNKDLKKTIHDLESDNATYAQQLSEANEMIESLQDVIKKDGENDKNSDKESIYEEKINENQEQLLKLYKVVDNEKAKRKELQQQLEKEKSESSKLKKRLSVFVKENSFLKNQSQRESFESEAEKKHKDKMNGDKERIKDLERKIIALEQDKSQLEDDLMNQNEKLQNMFAKETKLKQKTDEVITLLESERNKRIGLEEMLDNANSLLQKERMRVDELNQMILKENDHLKSREKKVEELMKQLEYESKVLRQRQSTHDDIEREIYAKKNEIETMEQEMREEKNKSVEERKKITSLLSSLDDVEQEKHKLARALQDAKLHAKTVKQQLEEKIYELNDIQDKKVSEERMMRETIVDLKEKLNNEKVASDISEDGKKLLNAGWTIAKVQRLYLKYFRAESFRKALAYQKRYLLLLLSEYQQNEDSVLAFIAKLKSPVVGERRRYNVAKRRFRVAANAIIAINRLKYLTRKYQRNLHKSSPEYIYKDKPSKSKDLPKPTLSVVTEERPVEKSRSLTRQSKPNTESSQQHRPALHKRRSSTDKRLRLHKRDSGGDSSLSNHVMFSPDNEAIKNIASPPDDEKDSRSESKVGRVTSGSHNETKISTTRKDTYSPPTRLNGSAATHVSLTVPANSAVTNRSPRSPPRSYPRPKQLPAVPKSDRSHTGKVNEPTKQDSSASLNNYISKLENLQERLKEQSKNVHKKRNPLL